MDQRRHMLVVSHCPVVSGFTWPSNAARMAMIAVPSNLSASTIDAAHRSDVADEGGRLI